ncbi:MAG: SDR family NAD(P)-dependent oxidoreductase [Actinobacteria bacterium]|nr:SDR family NAD(P)-dependent oxidoreductase [Actinomycetota bacterium]
MKPLAEQVVVVTGASSGIGRATALLLASRGSKVVCAARGVEALGSLVEEIGAAGGQALSVPTDVGDPAAVRRLAERAEERFSAIDTWVNGAAVSVYATVEDTTDEEFERLMRVNFLGHVYGVHAALPALRRAGGGVVIGISSVEGVRTVPLHGAYSASKRALRGMYDALRMELAAQGEPIAVTTILPASIDTPFFEHARSKLGAMPKPPPPVYAPELVARAIATAAEHPTREVPVGGAALAFIAGQRLSPALTDVVMSVPRLGFESQRSNRPDNGRDNLFEPAGDGGSVHGSHPGRVLRNSVLTSLLAHRSRLGDVLLRARQGL